MKNPNIDKQMTQEIFLFKSQLPQLNLSEDSEMLTDFSLEGQRHFISARNSLLVLDTVSSNKEAIENIFKTFHTLSGLADFLKLHDIYWITKTAESIMDLTRKEVLPFEGNVRNLILMALKRLQKLFELLDEQIENGGKLKSPYPDQEKLVMQLYHLFENSKKMSSKVRSRYVNKNLEPILIDDEKSFYDQLKKKVHSAKGNIVLSKEPLERLLDNFKTLDQELRQAQRKVQERQKDLILERELALRLTQKAKEESRSKSEYLSNMSHEIRTLINAILGFTDLIKDDLPENSKHTEHLNTVMLSGRMLLEIVNNILDFSKVESGRLVLESIPLNVREVIEDVFKVIRARLDSKPINLYLNIDADVPIHVIGDPTRLKQIFLNLLDNSVKFTEKGEIGISVSLDDSKKTAEVRNMIFTVKDSGIGIPKDRLSIIFDNFAQADTSTTRLYGGSGLGLALCKAFAEAMGGKISVKSHLGEGSEFNLTVGFKEAPFEELPLEQPLTDLNKCILVTPFDTTIKMFESIYSRISLSPLTVCRNIKHAAEVLSLLKTPPDFIFVDTFFNDGQPFKFADDIKKHHELGKTKIIAVSSDIKFKECLSNEDLPYDGIILTPVMMGEFIALIKKLSLASEKIVSKEDPDSEEDKLFYQGLKILVVEDSLPNQELLKVHFEALGCCCDYVSNGKEAIEYLRRMSYDLCFMDLQMPVMGGLEAVSIIRQELNLKLPIVALTAAEAQEEKEKCLQTGMNDYLPKPFDAAQLKEKLKDFLKK